MPSATFSITQSNRDGHQMWDQRSNASGTIFTGTTVYPFVGPHYSGANMYASFFTFEVTNLPQGSTINSCNLELRTNNAYTGGLTNHIYVAVENNLDPSSSGAVVNGTLGSQPWQRLGRQSAATTLFGNRCGPTHNKAGETLSSYGAHVRDTSAIIYKAFCTTQGSAGALGRDLPLGSWNQTEDFAAALQPLVNDPGWNSTSQFVMFYLFADISSGTDFNIGNLGSFTWDNGTVGASGYGNGGGQLVFYDQSSGTYAPKLNLSYTSTSLKAQNDLSDSYGMVRLSPAYCIGRLMGERAEIINGGAVIPKMGAGVHDLPFTGMNAFNSNDPLWNNGSAPGARVKWSTARAGRVDGSSLLLEDYAIGTYKTPQVWWDLDAYQDLYATRETYSLRFYQRFEQLAWVAINNHIVSFYQGVDRAFSIESRELFVDYPNPDIQMQLRVTWPGGQTAWTTYEFKPPSSNGFYRFEIQVSSSVSPKVRVRIYLNDATTPIETISANPVTTLMDKVIFGDTNTYAPIFNQKISDVEIWTDYRLNGVYPDDLANTTGTPFPPQQWSWYEYDGSSSEGLEDLGTVSSIAPNGSSVIMTGPSSVLTYEDSKSEIWDGGSPAYTKYADLSYGAGTFRKLDLYIPTGTPPAGGWPVIVYTHGGFWTSGDRYSSLSPQFVQASCLYGYAVASCSYVLNDFRFAAQGAYPAWDPNNKTGVYPSMILNYKEATHWLQTTAAPTYNLNPSKFVASGHSAGAYNALGAVVSKGLTNDGGGRDLTLAGNTSTFGCPNVADPTFLGAYILSAPINLNYLKSWDPTDPNWPYLGTGVGIMQATCRMFRGQHVDSGSGDVNFCGINDMITANAANVPSIAYAWGSTDYLVISNRMTPYSQEKNLADTMTSVAGSLPGTTTYEGYEVKDALHHTIHDIDFDFQHMRRWLKNLPGMN